MGLPKPTRLPKEAEVSIEDIYLQKDYRTPKTSSSLPTIIDENNPKVTKAVMTKQKKKRTIQFSTDPAARKVEYIQYIPLLIISNSAEKAKNVSSKYERKNEKRQY